MNNARWAEKQLASSLPVKYFHVVFTLPDSLNGFILGHQKAAYDALFEAASKSLLKLCADKKYLGAVPGMTAVLHTWGQTMQFHPHLHVIVTAGGLADGGLRFVDISAKNFLVPVKALSKLFRGCFVAALGRRAKLPFPLKNSLYSSDFSCHLEEPMERADNAVLYLARYANRVCISDSRIVCFDKNSRTVTFSYKDNRDGGREKRMTLHSMEFIRRFMLHVLPKRFMKIRHYGILNNRDKLKRIARCRRLLPRASAPRTPDTHKRPFACPKCGMHLSAPRHVSASNLQMHVRLNC
jgi:hypothetical protein